MMRIWLHSAVKSTVFGPSTAFSVVAHAVLIGAAVYGTGVRARAIEEAIAQRIFYLPPPDRRPSSENIVEHLQYLDVGSLTPVTNERQDGLVVAHAGDAKKAQAGGNAGNEAETQAPSTALESRDSVYSILDVEESATRSEGSAAPAYPPELMKEGKEGGVFIRFVVDSTGRADSSTIEVVRATHPLFALAVRQAVPQMMFSPASMGGRHVRQAVEQNFEFRITPPEHTKTPKPVP
ncbi:MAG: TonB family protein [Gemmatimonadetes bacterium]|jgi:TonB family protein|nr:TonB family protein [Gemmatimonadota bacterium]